MPVAILTDRGVVKVAGADARAFLQGLFTCDLNKVSPERAAYGALLTPQGKILCDFIVMEAEGAFLIDCPATLAGELAKRLRFYKLRAKVEIEDCSAGLTVLAGWDEPGPGVADPRHKLLGARQIVQRDGATPNPVAQAAYEAHRVALGAPAGGLDFAYGDAFPHDANMDLLGGVDFKKGCYIGQEVVSRVEHRGSARKRVARLSFGGPAPATGAALLAGANEIGRIGSVAGNAALATVRVDRLEEAVAAGAPILADNRPATVFLPARTAMLPA